MRLLNCVPVFTQVWACPDDGIEVFFYTDVYEYDSSRHIQGMLEVGRHWLSLTINRDDDVYPAVYVHGEKQSMLGRSGDVRYAGAIQVAHMMLEALGMPDDLVGRLNTYVHPIGAMFGGGFGTAVECPGVRSWLMANFTHGGTFEPLMREEVMNFFVNNFARNTMGNLPKELWHSLVHKTLIEQFKIWYTPTGIDSAQYGLVKLPKFLGGHTPQMWVAGAEQLNDDTYISGACAWKQDDGHKTTLYILDVDLNLMVENGIWQTSEVYEADTGLVIWTGEPWSTPQESEAMSDELIQVQKDAQEALEIEREVDEFLALLDVVDDDKDDDEDTIRSYDDNFTDESRTPHYVPECGCWIIVGENVNGVQGAYVEHCVKHAEITANMGEILDAIHVHQELTDEERLDKIAHEAYQEWSQAQELDEETQAYQALSYALDTYVDALPDEVEFDFFHTLCLLMKTYIDLPDSDPAALAMSANILSQANIDQWLEELDETHTQQAAAS